MKTRVSILHHDYPTGYRSLVEERLAALERFHDRIVTMDARIEKEARAHHVEIVANVGKGTPSSRTSGATASARPSVKPSIGWGASPRRSTTRPAWSPGGLTEPPDESRSNAVPAMEAGSC